MRINCKLIPFLFLLFSPAVLYGQLDKKIRDLIDADSVFIQQEPDSLKKAESIHLSSLDSIIREQKLNEMNLRLELENLRLSTISADSLKHARQIELIDSLRSVTKGIPVVVESDTLFTIYSKFGGYSPSARAKTISGTIEALGKDFKLKPDSVYIDSTEIATEIMYKGHVIASVTEQDALWENMNRTQLAKRWEKLIVQELVVLKHKHSLLQIFKRIGLFILVLLIQGLLFKLTTWLYKKLKNKIIQLKDSKLKAWMIKDYEVLNKEQEARMIIWGANLLRYFVIFLQLLITVPILFSIFPPTKALAIKLFSYILDPVKKILKGVIAYIPNLFTIIIIYIAVHYALKGLKYLAGEIESKRLKINGFYPDWAQPTYHILRFLTYAFMIAMIYPYLPGSDSKIFQGISVFVGVIVSLGSSSVISNIMAGLVITYMRPFKIGDRIKLNDVLGNVLEKTPFVTRLKTPKNEIVTIPNSFVMSTHTTNYSASTRKFGLIIHTEVTIGYDAAWRQIHQLLIDAALDTPGICKEPAPFVLETSLSDWYPVYQINAYILDADKQPRIMTMLLQNIQDHFTRAGVEIMSPHYFATRDGNESTIPKHPYPPFANMPKQPPVEISDPYVKDEVLRAPVTNASVAPPNQPATETNPTDGMVTGTNQQNERPGETKPGETEPKPAENGEVSDSVK